MIQPAFVRPAWSRRDFLRSGALATAGVAIGGWSSSHRSAFADTPPPASPASTEVPLSDLRPLLQELVREMEKKLPYASASVLRRRGTSISFDDQTQEINEEFPTQGAVFTVFNGAWVEEASTNDLSPDNLRAVARELAASVRLHSGGPAIDPGNGAEQTFRTSCERDPRGSPLKERFAWVEDLHRRARAIDPDLSNCVVDYDETIVDEVFVNRAKSWSQELVRLHRLVAFFTSKGQKSSINWVNQGGTGGLEILELSDDQLAVTAGEAHALLDAGPVEPGTYKLIVDGDITGTLAHESFGHGVELDMFLKDRALAEKFVGKRVGSELVNIIDDPSFAHGYGSYFFDDEGQRSSPTAIVKDGIFLRGLSDLMSATLLKLPRSANGRRQDPGRKAYARMSNTFFTAGKGSVEELIGGVDRGLYLRNLTHGMEDPKGWGIQVVAHIGEEIENGKRTGRLHSPVGITGYVPEVLASVDGVAGDFIMRPGTCGKGHKELVPVSTGGPHIRLTAPLG